MSENEHISTERIQLAVKNRDVLLSEEERKHFKHCRDCLALFQQVVMAETDPYDTGEE